MPNNILEVVIRARDELSKKVDQVNKKLRETGKVTQQINTDAKNHASAASNAYQMMGVNITNTFNRVRQAVTTTFNQIKRVMSNPGSISTSQLSKPFLNAAEQIKQRYSSMVEVIKGKLKQIGGSQIITIKGENGDVIKKIEVTRTELLKIKEMNADPFKNISTAGLKVLNGELGQATINASKFNGTAIQVGNSVKTVTTTMGSLGQIGSAVGYRLNSAFTTFKGKLSAIKPHFGQITTSVSMLQGTIMRAFGIVGVTSLSAFTIGAAITRDKINSVNLSLVGSREKLKELNGSISAATKGGVVGFNAVAKAVSTIGIKHNLTTEQLKKTPPILNKIGTLAKAMGKDGEAAATLMSQAFMGLTGNVRALKQLGITKEDLIGAGWSGAASDVDGYIKALDTVLSKKPEMQEYLNSFEGQTERVKMAIAGIGRSIGEIVLPFLSAFLEGFLSLHSTCPALTTALIVAAIAFVGLASAAMVLLPLLELLNIEIGEATIQQHLMNIAVLENPYVWIAIAIIALIAVLVYLYQTNDQVRESLNKIGEVVKGGLIVAWNALVAVAKAVWAALVRIGQILYTGLVPLWNSLIKIVQPVIPAFQRLQQVATDLWNAFNSGSSSGDALGVVVDIIGNSITVLVQVIVGLAEVVLAILVPAFTAVIDILTEIIRFITRVANAFNELMAGNISFGDFLSKIGEAILSLIAGILIAIGSAILNMLSGLGAILEPITGAVWEWLVGFGTWLSEQIVLLFTNIIAWITENGYGLLVYIGELLGQFLWAVIDFFINLGLTVYNGIISVVMSFLQQMSTWYVGFTTWLSTMLNGAIVWGINLVNNIRTAAYNLVIGFISYVSSLPGRFAAYLTSVINKIISFASTAYSSMRTAGQRLIDGLKERASKLPQVVWDELVHIKDNILRGCGMIWDAINSLAQGMIDHLRAKLKIFSPGILANTIGDEMGYLAGKIVDACPSVKDNTTELASNIIEGFNAVDLSSMKDTLSEAIPSSVAADTEVTQSMTMSSVSSAADGVSSDNYATIGNNSYDAGESVIGEALNPLMTMNSEAIAQSVTDMTAIVSPQLDLITLGLNNMTLASTMGTTTTLANNLQIIQSYSGMHQQIVALMNNIINKNIQGWNNIKTVTLQNLNSILISTKSVTAQMVSAWQSMKNSIVQAATQIQTEAQARFNTLWSHIRTFYHNIQHPGGAGSPSGSSHGSGGGRSITSSLRNAVSRGMAAAMYPQSLLRKRTVSYSSLKNGYSFNDSDITYLLTDNKRNSRVNNADIIRFVMGQGGNAGGWSGIVRPNTDFIRNESNKWKIAGPVILGKYATQSRFKVGQFENGSPNIDFDTFRGIAEDVFSQCHYEFYYDSERYGNWITAAYHGGMNCSDSTDFLIAMARACGLPATKVHGHWNQFGHFWANVAGRKMDTTGWMQRRTWTPSASHAGSPPNNFGEEDEDLPVVVQLLIIIIDLLKARIDNPVSVDLNNKADIKLNIKHELDGDLPNGLSEEDVVSIMNNNVNSAEFLRTLTSNRDFQDWDSKMKEKLLREIGRYS